ncbi:pleiotropic drug resistance protein 3-like [Gossypium australe]|uniref:Pleiotropic drug resistance protein 3-like n=1 Tax=Gossypium australe TaxID=47621 RepID=A0A5B6WK88_9ROSI|nr:pleiotropic drug resistance protein 3-like [Gossypium australe]
MKEAETMKQYADKIMMLANSKVIEKVITTLPERHESKISSLEDSRDLSMISLLELINEHAEEALRALSIDGVNPQRYNGKKGSTEKNKRVKQDSRKKKYTPCSHYKKNTHPKKYYCFRSDIKCR